MLLVKGQSWTKEAVEVTVEIVSWDRKSIASVRKWEKFAATEKRLTRFSLSKNYNVTPSKAPKF